MKKTIVMISLAVVLPLMLTGCWDRIEINDLAIVTGLGIDLRDGGEFELTAEITIPKAMGGGDGGSGKGGGGEATAVRSGTGRTIADAISDLQERLPRKLFWGHTKVIVLSEKIARSGIREYLDFFTRYPETRLRSHMFISEGLAKDVLTLFPPIEMTSSEVLREMSRSQTLVKTTLKDLLQMINGSSQNAIIPMITILPAEKGFDSLQTVAYINQTAIFYRDKMIGKINDEKTRGVLWFRNEIKWSNVTINMDKEEEFVSATLLRAQSWLVPSIRNGKWQITVKGELEDDIIINRTDKSMMDPEFVQELEQKLAERVVERMEQTLQVVQKDLKADVLGFAEAFRRKYPKEWKKVENNWSEHFVDVDVQYDIKALIRRPGLSGVPQAIPEEEVKK